TNLVGQFFDGDAIWGARGKCLATAGTPDPAPPRYPTPQSTGPAQQHGHRSNPGRGQLLESCGQSHAPHEIGDPSQEPRMARSKGGLGAQALKSLAERPRFELNLQSKALRIAPQVGRGDEI